MENGSSNNIVSFSELLFTSLTDKAADRNRIRPKEDFLGQFLALIAMLLDGAAKLIFLLISGIAKPCKLSWLVPSYHLIPERF